MQVNLQKRVPICQMTSVYLVAGKNRGLSFHEESEYSLAGWERGIAQNWLPFQDHRILWNRSGNSPGLEVREVVSLIELLYSTCFSILLFLEDSSYDLLEELFSLRCITTSFILRLVR